MSTPSYFSGKKVVITGAGGFIGSRLTKELLRQGAFVTAFARRSSNLWRVKDYLRDINWVYPDLGDYGQVLSHLQSAEPDFIYHLATYYSVDSHVDLSEIIDTNIKAGALLVKAAGEIKGLKLFINAGTGAEYGDAKDKTTEKTRPAPTTVYASTKAAGAMILHQMAEDHQVPLTTLRLYNVYGEYEAATRVVPYIIGSMLKDKDIELTACEQAKDYSYVGDFAKAFIQAAVNHEPARGKLFNIGSGKTIKMRRLVEEIALNFPAGRAKIKFGALPYRENEMWYQSTSIAAAKKYLDWRPETSLKQGVKITVDWYRENWPAYYG